MLRSSRRGRGWLLRACVTEHEKVGDRVNAMGLFAEIQCSRIASEISGYLICNASDQIFFHLSVCLAIYEGFLGRPNQSHLAKRKVPKKENLTMTCHF